MSFAHRKNGIILNIFHSKEENFQEKVRTLCVLCDLIYQGVTWSKFNVNNGGFLLLII